MRRPPLLLVLAIALGLILAACASPAGSGPGASAGGEPSTAPAESQAGGGGGGGGGIGGGSGSAQFEITGGYSASGDYPFVGDFGYFQQAGVSFLVFTEDESASEATGLILTISDQGNVLQYVASDITIPAATCDFNVTRNDASGAAGSFTCNDQAGFGSEGQVYTDLDINGSFDVSL